MFLIFVALQSKFTAKINKSCNNTGSLLMLDFGDFYVNLKLDGKQF